MRSRGRFEQEARILASLNHPHIGAIYGLEDGDGPAALVLELVDGPTLAERIAAGPITAEQVVVIARQLAEALEAAHERGIIHRDLKPANIKLAADGTVKVLDFGLAKAAGGAADADTRIVTRAATEAGVVMGTSGYMSPDQARGCAVDKRADIWAFGCVLFELCARQPAFRGATPTDSLAAVIERQPPWQLLPPSTPAYLRRLIERCLEKDPGSPLERRCRRHPRPRRRVHVCRQNRPSRERHRRDQSSNPTVAVDRG
jgi:serine/threonine protein kinase